MKVMIHDAKAMTHDTMTHDIRTTMTTMTIIQQWQMTTSNVSPDTPLPTPRLNNEGGGGAWCPREPVSRERDDQWIQVTRGTWHILYWTQECQSSVLCLCAQNAQTTTLDSGDWRLLIKGLFPLIAKLRGKHFFLRFFWILWIFWILKKKKKSYFYILVFWNLLLTFLPKLVLDFLLLDFGIFFELLNI